MTDYSGVSPWFIAMVTCMISYFAKKNGFDQELFQFPDVKLNDTYDFIIIGAGSAGSVVANRLSEVKDWRILLVEAGDEEDSVSDTPLLAITLWNSDKDWNYSTVEQKQACRDTEGICLYPRGHVLGGSSTLNFMNYVRGNKFDYDNWKSQGNEGWGYEDVLPYFLKSEDVKIKGLVNSKYHSTGGYLTVEESRYSSPLQKYFIKAGQELGFKLRDYNAEIQTGVSYPQFTMRKGTRCSTAKAFLSSIKDRPNIHISKRTRVLKIILNEKNNEAKGITVLKDGKEFDILASKEVIVSSGAIDSPKLLMLSGIGPKKHLEEVKVSPRVDLPVGLNLRDHAYIITQFKINDFVTLTKKRVENMDTVIDYAKDKNGPLASILGIDAAAHFTLNRKDDPLPDFQFFMCSLASFVHQEPIIMITVTKLRPESVGSVKLKSADPMDQPIIDPRLLGHPNDFEDAVKGCMLVLDLVSTQSLSKYNPKIFTKGSMCEGTEGEEYCRCTTRYHSRTMFHPVGTTKMGKDGVLDNNLKVWGFKNLRVVDTSMMPNITSGNTNAPAIMIAEKSADIIKKHWKII